MGNQFCVQLQHNSNIKTIKTKRSGSSRIKKQKLQIEQYQNRLFEESQSYIPMTSIIVDNEGHEVIQQECCLGESKMNTECEQSMFEPLEQIQKQNIECKIIQPPKSEYQIEQYIL
ncbi:hypothetical protein TTHERM_00261870 (macronuclear) [Tetrahymena thermophila SB210]|uniref:Uncharacterized protein n=1 Tax=Tetrahymena thermophila (strain SB210) TaxID=312017 RepID=Q22U97_TETTS|nr:hypothetical protein TTHERM_00261870 [Tetrahymena thermophila SB210]EAR88790.2 hypothetical protein TTHERM_00261870 [Tetrahymena thermophila SB210]|eukprot:XP_001009035.2 hypothetical protein TTHERM_00261870 [Tetrahymena thermophila SB210]